MKARIIIATIVMFLISAVGIATANNNNAGKCCKKNTECSTNCTKKCKKKCKKLCNCEACAKDKACEEGCKCCCAKQTDKTNE